MAKSTGLGALVMVGGYLVSNDVQSFQTGAPTAMLPMTGVDKSAFERQPGERDGTLKALVYFNKTGIHVPLSALPRTDVLATAAIAPMTVGAAALCVNGKQVDYDWDRGKDGSLPGSVDVESNGFASEWGVLLTPGVRTDSAATNGTSLDGGNGFATPAVPLTTVPVTNTSPLPATVVISAGTLTNVSVSGVTVGSGDGTYTVPSGGTIAITYSVAPTWTWTLQTPYGAQAYLQASAFTGTDVTVTVQHAPDNATWTTLVAFAQTTSAPGTQRVVVSNTTTVGRYLRAISATSAGFTNFAHLVMVNRNLSAGVVF